MAQELIFTSVPKGLKTGSYGYCTVAYTKGMSASTVNLLESLSDYYFLDQAELDKSPVSHRHYRRAEGGGAIDILSRVCFNGYDYTKRSNKLAHHLVLRPGERVSCGPAELFSQEGLFRESWEGEPRLFDQAATVRDRKVEATPAVSWKAVTGRAEWAGKLAESFLENPGRPSFIVFEPGMDVLPLLMEAARLIPVESRWRLTFNTYFTKLPMGVECAWRFCLKDSDALVDARRTPGALVIDLTTELGAPEGGGLLEAAATGKAPVAEPDQVSEEDGGLSFVTSLAVAESSPSEGSNDALEESTDHVPDEAVPKLRLDETNKKIRIDASTRTLFDKRDVDSGVAPAAPDEKRKFAIVIGVVALIILALLALFLLLPKFMKAERTPQTHPPREETRDADNVKATTAETPVPQPPAQKGKGDQAKSNHGSDSGSMAKPRTTDQAGGATPPVGKEATSSKEQRSSMNDESVRPPSADAGNGRTTADAKIAEAGNPSPGGEGASAAPIPRPAKPFWLDYHQRVGGAFDESVRVALPGVRSGASLEIVLSDACLRRLKNERGYSQAIIDEIVEGGKQGRCQVRGVKVINLAPPEYPPNFSVTVEDDALLIAPSPLRDSMATNVSPADIDAFVIDGTTFSTRYDQKERIDDPGAIGRITEMDDGTGRLELTYLFNHIDAVAGIVPEAAGDSRRFSLSYKGKRLPVSPEVDSKRVRFLVRPVKDVPFLSSIVNRKEDKALRGVRKRASELSGTVAELKKTYPKIGKAALECDPDALSSLSRELVDENERLKREIRSLRSRNPLRALERDTSKIIGLLKEFPPDAVESGKGVFDLRKQVERLIADTRAGKKEPSVKSLKKLKVKVTRKGDEDWTERAMAVHDLRVKINNLIKKTETKTMVQDAARLKRLDERSELVRRAIPAIDAYLEQWRRYKREASGSSWATGGDNPALRKALSDFQHGVRLLIGDSETGAVIKTVRFEQQK